MFISPMLLHQIDKPLDDNNLNFITELKYDGYRLILFHFDKTTLYTRHQTNYTEQFGQLLDHNLPYGTILDGEVIVPDSKGRPDFETLQSHSKKQEQVYVGMIFDILYFRGKSVMDLPLLERKQLLNDVLPYDTENLIKVPYNMGYSTSYFEAVKNTT